MKKPTTKTINIMATILVAALSSSAFTAYAGASALRTIVLANHKGDLVSVIGSTYDPNSSYKTCNKSEIAGHKPMTFNVPSDNYSFKLRVYSKSHPCETLFDVNVTGRDGSTCKVQYLLGLHPNGSHTGAKKHHKFIGSNCLETDNEPDEIIIKKLI